MINKKIAESLVAVHTHTHTHGVFFTKEEFEKIRTKAK